MTVRKVIDLARHESRKRRGQGRILGTDALGDASADVDTAAFAQAVGVSPDPEFAAVMAEQCGRLLGRLSDPQLQALAIAKMQGYSNEEIAEQLQCSVRTVERRLHLIRKKWESEAIP